MRPLMLFILVFTTGKAFCQKELFDTLKIDATTKIIGRYPEYDEKKTYKKYNFLLDKPNQIKHFLRILRLGNETENSIEDPSFEIDVIKNMNKIGSWIINPTLNSVITQDGHTYGFDLKQISKLHEKNPFDYFFKAVKFKSKNEYESYLKVQKRNSNFLFDYEPMFKYDGTFEIEFEKSEKFSSPQAISRFLSPIIKKIVSEDEYDISYILDDKNMANLQQFTMTISGPKRLFERMKVDNLQNINWKPIVEEGYFFYRK